ncbi:MAG: hypothetical protein ABI823_03860 [Bryobacteraceae bacterium]
MEVEVLINGTPGITLEAEQPAQALESERPPYTQEIFREDLRLVVRFTRHWIHYGWMTFTVVATLIAAVEGVFAR